MAQNSVNSHVRETLSSVRIGMTVWDRNRNKVGKVKDIQRAYDFGDMTPKMTEFYRLPDELQGSLMQEGYIQVDAGLFSRDRFVSPHQIAEISDDGLELSVAGEALLKA